MSKKYQNINDGEDMPERPKKRFTLNPFENLYTKDGKGVEKDELKVLDSPGIASFFKLLRRKLNHIFSVNILLIFGNFPVIFPFIAFAYTTGTAVAPGSQLYSALDAVSRFDNSPAVTSLLGIFGGQDTLSVMTTATYVLCGLAALLLFTFGPVNAGTAYLLRNIIKGEPVFVWSDFVYALKKNYKQALIFGIIDIFMIAMLAYDIIAYRINLGGNAFYTFMFVLSSGLAIIYFFIRTYVYLMMITFDLSIFKLIKNGVFFSVLGIKRNFAALLATLIVVFVDVWLMRVFLPLGIILPFIILFGLLWFVSVYAAYPKIKEVMIDPYYKELPASDTGASQ